MIRQVNDNDISEEAVDFELRRLIQFYSQHMPAKQIKENMPALRDQAREQAIGVRLLIREAHRQNIPVTDDEVDEALSQIVDQAGSEDRFLEMLEQQKITEELLKESLKDSKRVDKLIQKVTVNVPKPAEQELLAYHKDHITDFVRPERRRAQHILIKLAKGDPNGRNATAAKLQALKDAHAAGSDFSELAAAHSDCPSGKEAGGSIGWVVRGVLTPVFDEAVFSTAIGKTSNVIETPLGLHITLSSATEAGGTAPYEEVKDQIAELLMHNRRGAAISAFVETLKSKKTTE